MFRLTSEVTIDHYKIAVHAMSWRMSVDNFVNTAVIKLPAIAMLKRKADVYERVQTGQQIKEGMPVEIKAGYDGENDSHFKGFVRRIVYKSPLEVECEGYSYQLRKKNFNKSYRSGFKLKKLLADLVEGTDIKLSSKIPDVAIQSNVPFKNFRGVDVLEWIKDSLLLTVYFYSDTLYVGLRETVIPGEVKYRLGWNTVKDDDLKFNTDKEFAQVKIVVKQPRKRDGAVSRGIKDSKYTDTLVKSVKVRMDDGFLNDLAADQKKVLSNRGYEGNITAFLKPFAAPSMTAIIEDTKYPERTGRFFIEGVEGDFGPNGGRQKVKIGNAL